VAQIECPAAHSLALDAFERRLADPLRAADPSGVRSLSAIHLSQSFAEGWWTQDGAVGVKGMSFQPHGDREYRRFHNAEPSGRRRGSGSRIRGERL